MHEMSLTQGLIEVCVHHANGRQVRSVVVEIGKLGSVVPEAVEFCFEACAKGTLLEHARLHILQIPGTGRCRECGTVQSVASRFDPCTACGGYGVMLESGDEMRVREIEVDD
jgi:hydrogenase nickel incorporation protein HypA/HybF